jgi:hypothetical protein
MLLASITETIVGGVIAAVAGLLAALAAGVLAERARKPPSAGTDRERCVGDRPDAVHAA